MPTVSREVSIINSQGLHARPAIQFVDLANRFVSGIVVRKCGVEPYDVDGKSIMQMMTLEAHAGTKLEIIADGEDAEVAVDELVCLVRNKFGED